MGPRKPILCLDFDGVIHSYGSGWKGADVIPDPPVPGAFDFIRKALVYFSISIFSSRSNQPGGRDAMIAWFQEHGWPGALGPEGFEPEYLDFPREKPAAFLTIDDRGLTFDGTWPNPEELLAFQPWNKRVV